VAVNGPVKTVDVRGRNAGLEHVITLNIYVVQEQRLQPGFEVFQRVWGDRPNPPLVTAAFVSALAHPDFLAELDAVAVVPG
jgi:enamine deaminase RidA (YjgF/YER057c/UK114 family)